MNSIFCAAQGLLFFSSPGAVITSNEEGEQKRRECLSIRSLWESILEFLQQAAHITGGTYLKSEAGMSIAQLLLVYAVLVVS